jgi:zinc protease
MAAVSADIRSMVVYGLDDRYFDTYAERVRSVTAPAALAAAQEVLKPDRLLWVVVGDRSRIETGLRELNLGPMTLIDADGNPLGAAASAR